MYDEELVMDHLGVLVTIHCNLNCRDCADLIPKRTCRHKAITICHRMMRSCIRM